jgi:hypothetical protein
MVESEQYGVLINITVVGKNKKGSMAWLWPKNGAWNLSISFSPASLSVVQQFLIINKMLATTNYSTV